MVKQVICKSYYILYIIIYVHQYLQLVIKEFVADETGVFL